MFITAVPIRNLFAWGRGIVGVGVIAVPIIKLFAWGVGVFITTAITKSKFFYKVKNSCFLDQKRVEWAFGKWYSRKPLLQSGDINYETWF